MKTAVDCLKTLAQYTQTWSPFSQPSVFIDARESPGDGHAALRAGPSYGRVLTENSIRPESRPPMSRAPLILRST